MLLEPLVPLSIAHYMCNTILVYQKFYIQTHQRERERPNQRAQRKIVFLSVCIREGRVVHTHCVLHRLIYTKSNGITKAIGFNIHTVYYTVVCYIQLWYAQNCMHDVCTVYALCMLVQYTQYNDISTRCANIQMYFKVILQKKKLKKFFLVELRAPQLTVCAYTISSSGRVVCERRNAKLAGKNSVSVICNLVAERIASRVSSQCVCVRTFHQQQKFCAFGMCLKSLHSLSNLKKEEKKFFSPRVNAGTLLLSHCVCELVQ